MGLMRCLAIHAGRAVAVFCLLLLASFAQAQDQARKLALAPVPSWVDDLPDVTGLAPVGGDEPRDLVPLFIDQQFAWPDGRRAVWTRKVHLIRTDEGSYEASLQYFEFDAAFESFALTRVSIWRDGVARDVTDDLVIHGEFGATEGGSEEDPAGAGQQALVLFEIPGLMRGDIVDIAVLRPARGLPAGLDRDVLAVLEHEDQPVLSRAVVNWPKDWGPHVMPLPDSVSHTQSALPDGGSRYEYQVFAQDPPRLEAMVPAWIDQRATLRMTADEDWGQITRALAPHYEAHWPIGDWARLPQLSDALGEAAVIAALRLVQERIEPRPGLFSRGTALARPPEEVIRRGEGTAADIALLLASLLRDQGLQADVALTDGFRAAGLDQMLPAAHLFGHAVVRLRLDDQTYWLDPAALGQGSRLATLTPPDYGFALPLVEGTLAPEAIPADPGAIWTTETHETYRYTVAGIYIDVVSDSAGGAADDLRYRGDEWGAAELSTELFDYYRAMFPGLRLREEPELIDDPLANRIRMYERYFIPIYTLYRDGLMDAFPVAAEDFVSDLPADEGQEIRSRKFPMSGVRAGRYTHVIELQGFPGDLTLIAPIVVANSAFRYSLNVTAPTDRSFRLEWSFLGTGAEIPAAEVSEVLDDARIVHDTTWFEYVLD